MPGFDEVLQPNSANQLRVTSVIRLANLTALPADDINRSIGYIPDTLHRALLQRLADQVLSYGDLRPFKRQPPNKRR